MTCREFIDTAESLTPAQLLGMQAEDGQVSAHARECANCGKWMESQRLLGGALQTLRARTAQREASPKVEEAVLLAFRTHGFQPALVVAPERSVPAAWKLSRFFEIGAYAAVAAALIVGIFLGARMWQDRQVPATGIQAQRVESPWAVESGTVAEGKAITPSETKTAEIAENSSKASLETVGSPVAAKRTTPASTQATAINFDKQGFVALMFCDPLICADDEQVIRMELPPSGAASADGTSTQPVIADVVVGDDGLVRAMRIVN